MCTSPVTAYQSFKKNENGKSDVLFKFPKNGHLYKEIKLPCNNCIACRKSRTREWANRIMNEAKFYEHNQFLTLTYDDEHKPEHGTLRKEDYTLFMKRLRKKYPDVKIRYLQCGEYGEESGRPHHHAALFNLKFPDQEQYSPGENPLYTSKILDELWQQGECKIGKLTEASANYIAGYIFKKYTGELAKTKYERVIQETGEIINLEPEYITMSNRPGIGHKFYEKYKDDLYPGDFAITSDYKKTKVPKYYDKKLEEENPELLDELKEKRQQKAKARGEKTRKELEYQANYDKVIAKQNKRNKI